MHLELQLHAEESSIRLPTLGGDMTSLASVPFIGVKLKLKFACSKRAQSSTSLPDFLILPSFWPLSITC